ncbi:hypothetical protein HK101_008927 [Irineochytrium annulatum]|nr:hypothetical protein HK101_008927 [Irineochytrium annulatum]
MLRQGRFVVAEGETYEEQLLRTNRSRYHDSWNIKKFDGQVFVRCLLCGLLCCKQPTKKGEVLHHKVAPFCVMKMQQGWHWVNQRQEEERIANEEEEVVEPESLYLRWLREVVRDMGSSGKTTMVQWEAGTKLLDFLGRQGDEGKVTYVAVKGMLDGKKKGAHPYDMLQLIMATLCRREDQGGMELPCQVEFSTARTTAREANIWTARLGRTVWKGSNRWMFTFTRRE